MPLAVIFFDLFRVVSRSFALLVVFLMLTGTAIGTVALLNRFAPLIILHGGNFLNAFNAEQLQAPMPRSCYMNLASPPRWCFLDFIASRSDTWFLSRPSFPAS
jgi:hypothetical protein